jgi:hypothetical protein
LIAARPGVGELGNGSVTKAVSFGRFWMRPLLRDQPLEISWMKFAASELDNVALGNGIEVLVASEYRLATPSAAVNRPCARTRLGLDKTTYKEDTSKALGNILVVKGVREPAQLFVS